jgi:hypothetical protein
LDWQAIKIRLKDTSLRLCRAHEPPTRRGNPAQRLSALPERSQPRRQQSIDKLKEVLTNLFGMSAQGMLNASLCPIDVDDQRKSGSLDVFEKENRLAFPQGAYGNLRHFQVRIDFNLDPAHFPD